MSNAREVDAADWRCLPDLFAEQVERSPDAIAIRFEGESLTYAQLSEQSNRLARVLIERGAGPDSIVPILIDRSPQAIVAILGVLTAGGCYLPLDPDAPVSRTQIMVDDSGASLILTTAAHAETAALLGPMDVLCIDAPDAREDIASRRSDCVGERERGAAPGPSDPAFVIYTSGTTGTPKGSVNTQGGIVNYQHWLRDTWRLNADDRVLHQTTLIFDMAVSEILLPLITGAVVVIARPGGQTDPAYIARLIQAEAVTVAFFVPTMLQYFLDDDAAADCETLRLIHAGGEVLTGRLQALCHARLPAVTLWNSYGPSEAAVVVTLWRCRRQDDDLDPPIGYPFPRTDLHILDEDLQPVAPGTAGELFIAGTPLSRGYLRRPELTAEKFLPCPFGPPGALMYRTGDIVARRNDGALEYHGRRDSQIKINGVRVEPGEIEAAIAALAGIAGVAVVPRVLGGKTRLVAYLIAQPAAATLNLGSVRAALAERLPSSMVPSFFMVLKEFPRTASGKLAVRELPDPPHQPHEAPCGPVEVFVAAVFQEVLGARTPDGWRVGRLSHFFLDGGDSLSAIRVMARLAAAGWGEHPPELLFDNPTPAALARALGPLGPVRAGPVEAQPITADIPEGCQAYPASSAQSRLWFLHQLEPRPGAYHLPLMWRLRGELDPVALASALTGIVERHPTLRTSFTLQSGELLQVIHPAHALTPEPEDLGDRELATVIAAWEKQEQDTPFDLTAGLLLRTRLLRIGRDDHLLLLNHHHIASDGWSLPLLTRDLGALYTACRAGTSPQLPQLEMRYQDYTQWHRQRLSGEHLARLREYWISQLSGLEPLELPTDRPRPAVASHRGASLSFVIPPELLRPFEELCRREQVTLQMGLLALHAVVLHRHSRQQDLAIGVPIFGRYHPDLEQVVGFFVNTLPIRTRLTHGMAFRELLRQVRAASLAAYEHQDLPFEVMVEGLPIVRDISRNPLVQVVLQLVEVPESTPMTLDGVAAEAIPLRDSSARFDLEFTLRRSADAGLSGRVVYAAGLFAADRVDRLVGHVRELMKIVVGNPDSRVESLDMLPHNESRRIENWQHGPDLEVADFCVHQLFDEQVRRDPEAVAVVFEGQRLSYAELNRRANRLAHHLVGLGAGPDCLVAVCLERSVEMVVALLAILKAGAAYLPLDPGWPLSRHRLVLAEAGPSPVLITNRAAVQDLADGCRLLDPNDPGIGLHPTASPDASTHTTRQLAYVNFTSGSTGTPKGVLIPHRGILRLIDPGVPWRIGPGDHLLHLAPIAFDSATLEIWVPLLSGATLVIGPPKFPALAELAELLSRHQISMLWLTSGLFHAMADAEPAALAGVRTLLAGGDVVNAEAARTVLDLMPAGHVLINGYGPTEATTFASYHVMAAGSAVPQQCSIPIGRPLAATTLQVLDPAGRRCPIGVPGELHIGGDGLARGYLNDPQLTAAKFVADANRPEARLYRSGDLAAWNTDGTLTFLGRIDQEVKLRGFRVEPGEIEAALLEHPAVARAVVVLRDDAPANPPPSRPRHRASNCSTACGRRYSVTATSESPTTSSRSAAIRSLRRGCRPNSKSYSASSFHCRWFFNFPPSRSRRSGSPANTERSMTAWSRYSRAEISRRCSSCTAGAEGSSTSSIWPAPCRRAGPCWAFNLRATNPRNAA